MQNQALPHAFLLPTNTKSLRVHSKTFCDKSLIKIKLVASLSNAKQKMLNSFAKKSHSENTDGWWAKDSGSKTQSRTCKYMANRCYSSVTVEI